MLSIIKALNATVAFALELATLVAVGYWPFTWEQTTAIRTFSALGLVAVMASVWGTFGSPGSSLTGVTRIVFEVFWFGLGIAAVYTTRRPRLAAVFAVVFVVNAVLARVLHQIS
ncbi:YrdB family protein [Nocardia sp.]|uniref:YrdB family protein n=1 Tax=Nocardia sp. TaxID=1821 RepID=UPI002630F86A|nr:YrdB family protein [Nocardia sp.]